MALQKNKMTDFGIEASYWKIGMVTIDRQMKEATISINLFLNKDSEKFIETYIVSSLMGKDDKKLYNKYFEYKNNEYTDIYNACYMYAKENEEYFKDAIDV